jgi:uncharacterized protein YceK
MARARFWAKAALVASAALGGCGTIRNMNDQREVFGGVKIDNEVGVKYRDRQPKDGENDAVNAARWAATVVDLPLTVVGDTLTLPVILYWQSQTTADKRNPSPAPSPPPSPPAAPATSN